MKRAVSLEYGGKKILAYTTEESAVTLYDFCAMGLPDELWPYRIADIVVDHEVERIMSVDPQYNSDWKKDSDFAVLSAEKGKSFFDNLDKTIIVNDIMSLQELSELERCWEYETKGSYYRWHDQLGIRDRRFFCRSVASFHGDSIPFPDFYEIRNYKFADQMADAVASGTIREIK